MTALHRVNSKEQLGQISRDPLHVKQTADCIHFISSILLNLQNLVPEA